MPQKFVNFPFTRQKYRRDQRMPTGLTPQNDFGVTLQKSSSMGGGGALNGMAHSLPNISKIPTFLKYIYAMNPNNVHRNNFLRIHYNKDVQGKLTWVLMHQEIPVTSFTGNNFCSDSIF